MASHTDPKGASTKIGGIKPKKQIVIPNIETYMLHVWALYGDELPFGVAEPAIKSIRSATLVIVACSAARAPVVEFGGALCCL